MKRRDIRRITIGFIAIVVLLLTLMLVNSMRSSSRITLPKPSAAETENGNPSGTPENELLVVEITPATVQTAIETLSRPESYQRTVRVRQFWGAENGEFDVTVAVRDGWVRTDRAVTADQIRHTLTDGEKTYIWYNQEKTCFSGLSAGISADREQTIPTYEDVLALPKGEIAQADYRSIAEDANCIYVETTEDEAGYVWRYWVSVDTGLLVTAERLQNEETIYQMSSLSAELALPDEALFTLPDGRKLLT